MPVGPVRDHIVALKRDGDFGLERIADAAQVSRSAVLDVYFGPRGDAGRRHRESGRTQVIGESTARRIMAVTPESIESAFVAPTGTVRRLQALVAIGYTETELATRLGMLVGNFNRIILGLRPRVTAGTYRGACALFSESWSHPKSGGQADRARRLAASRGWVGPLAWDDIDDPSEQPQVDAREDQLDAVDETAVDLALAGWDVALTPTERREAVTRLHRARFSDARIAGRLHCAERTVLRIRQELGLAAFDQADLVRIGAA
ncbi:hypothetical protein MN032_17715 [Agromyces atrinae]|uniref:hypothetical protein n=1 Tax=Agromyces atrinae TaxID=592376 RepID=UPI001F573BEF|nr:hypothetical protein [Agromyces atrinae]MCI2959526.1 hypothetical protein [Agromyces atrinae]